LRTYELRIQRGITQSERSFKGNCGKSFKVFENSYELSKASIKTLTNIEQISIENAISIHEHFNYK